MELDTGASSALWKSWIVSKSTGPGGLNTAALATSSQIRAASHSVPAKVNSVCSNPVFRVGQDSSVSILNYAACGITVRSYFMPNEIVHDVEKCAGKQP